MPVLSLDLMLAANSIPAELESLFVDRTAALPVGEAQSISGTSEVGTGKPTDDDLLPLSQVINAINKRFGTEFAEGDRLLMVQAFNDMAGDAALAAQARTNTLDNLRHAFEPAAVDAVLNRNQRNGEITDQFMGNPELRQMILDAMMLDFYKRVRQQLIELR